MGTGRLELLEQRIVELEKAVDEMKADIYWWKWWWNAWGKWMQQVVPELTSMKRNLAKVFRSPNWQPQVQLELNASQIHDVV